MLFINRRFLGKIRAAAAGELIHNLRTPAVSRRTSSAPPAP